MQYFNGTIWRSSAPEYARPKVGCVDEVAIYNRSLGAAEIKSHFEGEKLRYEFMVVNQSGFSASALDDANRAFTRMPLNNFSQPQYYDDSYTVLLEHFDSLQEIGWNNGTVYGNFSICEGKFGTGGCFDGESGYVVIVLPE